MYQMQPMELLLLAEIAPVLREVVQALVQFWCLRGIRILVYVRDEMCCVGSTGCSRGRSSGAEHPGKGDTPCSVASVMLYLLSG